MARIAIHFCAPTDIAAVTLDHMELVSVQSPEIPVAESTMWGPVILPVASSSRMRHDGAQLERRHTPHLVSPTWISREVTLSWLIASSGKQAYYV
jgi:hypothetical protein